MGVVEAPLAKPKPASTHLPEEQEAHPQRAVVETVRTLLRKPLAPRQKVGVEMVAVGEAPEHQGHASLELAERPAGRFLAVVVVVQYQVTAISLGWLQAPV